MEIKAYEQDTSYLFVVTETVDEKDYTFNYEYIKQPPAGQTKTQYLQNCKSEAELLAQYELDKLAPPKEILI